MGDISEKTKVPLGLVITLVALAAGGVAQGAVAQYQLKELREGKAKLEQEVEDTRKLVWAHQNTQQGVNHAVQLQLQEQRLTVNSIMTAIGRLEAVVDERLPRRRQ